MLPNMKKPCKDCPFRKDTLKGWLGKQKMEEILSAHSFVCHKKTDLQCAGHMHIKGEENTFVRTAQGMNIDTGLSSQDLIFATEDECIAHHSER